MKKKRLSYSEWMALGEIEKTSFKEDYVFSHGNLTLSNIIINGNGLVVLTGMQKAGVADRYRDIATLLPSLEEAGVKREEFFDLLGLKIDENKIQFFQCLNSLTSRKC